MTRAPAILIALGLSLTPALAQDALLNENVIVTAPRVTITANAQAHQFIRTYTAPSVLTRQIARWNIGICPRVGGLPERYLEAVTSRIKEVAKEVGAPVKPGSCRPN